MDIELVESGKTVTLKSLTRKQMRVIGAMDAELNALLETARNGGDKEVALTRIREITAQREDIAREAYPALSDCWEDLANREVLQLVGATMDYSRAVPEDEIKNWLRSGNGETTRTA